MLSNYHKQKAQSYFKKDNYHRKSNNSPGETMHFLKKDSKMAYLQLPK